MRGRNKVSGHFLASNVSVLMNVHTELNMFCRDNVEILRAQGLSIAYLAPFDGMDEDNFCTLHNDH